MVMSWLRHLRDEVSWYALQCSWEAFGSMERAVGVDLLARFSANPVLIARIKEAAL